MILRPYASIAAHRLSGSTRTQGTHSLWTKPSFMLSSSKWCRDKVCRSWVSGLYSTRDILASLKVSSSVSRSLPVSLALAMDWIQPNSSQLPRHSIFSLLSASWPPSWPPPLSLASRSGTSLNTRSTLAPATTRFFSDEVKKLQESECSTPVAGCEDRSNVYILLNHLKIN